MCPEGGSLAQWAWQSEHQLEDNSWVLTLDAVCHVSHVRVGLAYNLLPISLLFLPFVMGLFTPYISQHCILEAHNLFDFTDLQMERKVPQDESYHVSYEI